MLDEDKTLEMVQTLISALPTAEESAQVAESGLVRVLSYCGFVSFRFVTLCVHVVAAGLEYWWQSDDAQFAETLFALNVFDLSSLRTRSKSPNSGCWPAHDSRNSARAWIAGTNWVPC
jgi:hypothetical protein